MFFWREDPCFNFLTYNKKYQLFAKNPLYMQNVQVEAKQI